MNQMTMNFDPVYHQQWECCREYMDDKVIPDYLKDKSQLKKHLAADLEMSPSDLRRKLCPSEGDVRNFTLDDLERWLAVTGELKPLFYLLEKYAGNQDAEEKIQKLQAEIDQLRGGSIQAVS